MTLGIAELESWTRSNPLAQAHELKQYKLAYTMREPSEDSGGMYVVGIPAMPDCMAWGKSPDEALHILEGVAADFIHSFKDHDEPLPDGVDVARELMITV